SEAGSGPASGGSQRLDVEPQPCEQTANKATCSCLVSQQGVVLQAVFGRDHRTLLGNDGGTFSGTVCRRTCLLQDRPSAALGDRILGHDRTPQACAGFTQGRRRVS